MERWAGRTALVTGASVGIGAAVSKALVKHGMRVIGCGRNLDKLEEMSKRLEGPGSFHAIRCDISKEEDILHLFKTIEDDFRGVDVCINNVGVSHTAPLLSGDTAQWKNMLHVNVLGLSVCTREAIKSMRDRKIDDGHVINISSMLGHRVVNSISGHFYCATKFAVRALTEGVRNELRDIKSHIRISEISPGLTETEFVKRLSDEKRAAEFYATLKCLEPDDIANAAVYILSAPPHVQVHDILIRPTEQIA